MRMFSSVKKRIKNTAKIQRFLQKNHRFLIKNNKK